ncbi:MAG: hypothetical protein LBV80_03765 [Deltaproteobacteria bacterium]|jgi:hypothetical protein|nr:hypothetical protein [Deltaproteobacteria bacterium]
MGNNVAERSPEFQEFVRQAEALIKASAEARPIAEQTGTRLIVCEDSDLKKYGVQIPNNPAMPHANKP